MNIYLFTETWLWSNNSYSKSYSDSIEIKSLLYKDILRIINRISIQQWQSQWDTCFQPVVCKTDNKLKKYIKKSVKKLWSPTNTAYIVDITITTDKIGHTRLTHFHLYKKQSVCHKCDILPTIEHLTTHYPKYNEEWHILSYSNMKEVLDENNTDSNLTSITPLDL